MFLLSAFMSVFIYAGRVFKSTSHDRLNRSRTTIIFVFQFNTSLRHRNSSHMIRMCCRCVAVAVAATAKGEDNVYETNELKAHWTPLYPHPSDLGSSRVGQLHVRKHHSKPELSSETLNHTPCRVRGHTGTSNHR